MKGFVVTGRTVPKWTAWAWVAAILTVRGVSMATTYYVDGATGRDTNPGRSPAAAWRSLERVNQVTFQPGDRVLFKAGTRYTGQLKPQGSGKVTGGKVVPITIDMYGKGTKPRIDAEGKFDRRGTPYLITDYRLLAPCLGPLGPRFLGNRSRPSRALRRLTKALSTMPRCGCRVARSSDPTTPDTPGSPRHRRRFACSRSRAA